MNTRAVHKALSYLERHASWQRDGETEWHLVGDGVSYDVVRLQALVDTYFKAEKVIASVDRDTAFEVARQDLAKSLNAGEGYVGRPFGRILVTDFNMVAIIELQDMGVARCGTIEDNAQAREHIQNERS